MIDMETIIHPPQILKEAQKIVRDVGKENYLTVNERNLKFVFLSFIFKKVIVLNFN